MDTNRSLMSSGSQLGVIWPPMGHLAMSKDIFTCNNWRRQGAAGI